MSRTHDSHSEHGADRPWGEDVVAQLRAMADGEMAESERRDFSALLGEKAEAGAEFERGLRGAVGRVMLEETPGAPDGLRERIRLAMREAPSHEFASEEPLSITPSISAPWGVLAAAAILLTVGAALLMRGLPGPAAPVSPGVIGTQSASIISAEQASYLVSFITRQHDSCAVFGEKFNRKMVARTEAEAARAAIELLSEVPTVLEIGSERLFAAGYEFAGLGRCHLPGEGRTAHLLYRSRIDGDPSVSLFIQEDTGEMSLAPDRFYACDVAEKNGTTLSVWKKNGLIYYLFTPDLEHAPQARELFGAPLLRGTIS